MRLAQFLPHVIYPIDKNKETRLTLSFPFRFTITSGTYPSVIACQTSPNRGSDIWITVELFTVLVVRRGPSHTGRSGHSSRYFTFFLTVRPRSVDDFCSLSCIVNILHIRYFLRLSFNRVFSRPLHGCVPDFVVCDCLMEWKGFQKLTEGWRHCHILLFQFRLSGFSSHSVEFIWSSFQ